MELSILALKRIISSQTEKQVSKDSAKELGKQLEYWSQGIASRANQIAEQQGRKTVQGEDIRTALIELKHSQKPDYRVISGERKSGKTQQTSLIERV